ncbi:uncharacterized protein LAESUDRAFT_731790 [Laetiporus sulphureus 93-53]|uniref:Uncharacterized protein n=1 Tax=Laetiporus sulphureus 93-53 TaxID=1314785 RepID=A0A165BFK7_9APHY|nr:uncharacterized protein LAESUDRAFT_731790 [Laetiporus sulphureus 93-53]KZT00950.1 hypothetical protein LAESUDRAFT_731790 [Laetiporus sulphureus 93-53]
MSVTVGSERVSECDRRRQRTWGYSEDGFGRLSNVVVAHALTSNAKPPRNRHASGSPFHRPSRPASTSPVAAGHKGIFTPDGPLVQRHRRSEPDDMAMNE